MTRWHIYPKPYITVALEIWSFHQLLSIRHKHPSIYINHSLIFRVYLFYLLNISRVRPAIQVNTSCGELIEIKLNRNGGGFRALLRDWDWISTVKWLLRWWRNTRAANNETWRFIGGSGLILRCRCMGWS